MTRPDPGLRQQRGLRSALRIIGPLLFGIGLILAIAGMASFFSSFGSFSGPPTGFWMAFVGLPLMGVGGWITQFAYLGPASRYVAGEVTPTLRDTLGALGIGGERRLCAACGAENDAEATFCDSCGKPLDQTCASCGARNDAKAQFCDSCGKPLAG
jgi:ribosomal protein L40E